MAENKINNLEQLKDEQLNEVNGGGSHRGGTNQDDANSQESKNTVFL